MATAHQRGLDVLYTDTPQHGEPSGAMLAAAHHFHWKPLCVLHGTTVIAVHHTAGWAGHVIAQEGNEAVLWCEEEPMFRSNAWQGVDRTVSPQLKNTRLDEEAADFDLDAGARALGRQSVPIALGCLSEPETGRNLTYGAALGLAREDAITLGVPGCNAEANARRGLLTHDILHEWTERSDRAYRAAVWPSEPDVSQPFGVRRQALMCVA